MSIEYLKNKKTIFWDFDGVIKDSVEIKSDAFEELFLPFGTEVSKKIRAHHEKNGGVSRFDKVPLYIKWIKKNPTQDMTDKYSEKFSVLVKQKVIDSEWVPGVLNYLKSNYNNQQFFLLTATPQKEIDDIIESLKIKCFFEEIVGAPTKKVNSIMDIVKKYPISLESSVMIGDSIDDYRAAKANNLPFVLRRTKLNKKLQLDLKCKMIYNFQ